MNETRQSSGMQPSVDALAAGFNLWVTRLITAALNKLLALAVVTAISGNTAKVKRNGQAVADDTFYPVNLNIVSTLTVGDTVLVIRGGANYVIVCRIPTPP